MLRIIFFIFATIQNAYAVKTFHFASKCIPVEDSAITRRIGATSGVWVRAENECEKLGKIATNQNYYYQKNKTYFRGITMDFSCIKIGSAARWRQVGCSGGLELGYLLEVTADIENPVRGKYYYPRDYITYYNNQQGYQECLAEAQQYNWFSSNQIITESSCSAVSDSKIKREVRLKFNL